MTEKVWEQRMPDEQFEFMKKVLAAPSPVGFEASMTHGVLIPYFQQFKPSDWKIHTFKGNAGLVLDSDPQKEKKLSVMLVGHADKIRLQVRQIGEDGKIWIDSDSFLPTTLIGHEVLLFSENPKSPGQYRVIEGATIEAIGAIHFSSPEMRSGKQGITKQMLYADLQIYGDKKKEQVERLGIRPGDALILNRPIKRGFSPNTFYGAYLDNGLGCFACAEIARLLAKEGGLKNTRLLAGIAAYEEIGRMGSRVLARAFSPDVLIAIDVSHDFLAAPNLSNKRMTPNAMGEGFTLAVGSIVNPQLNSLYETVTAKEQIPMQRKVVGHDTGTDAMASVLASVDSAATSIGFPIRNMHTISESGHTGDVLASIYGTIALLKYLDNMHGGMGASADDFKKGHPRLDQASSIND